jgi:hypothetical protein
LAEWDGVGAVKLMALPYRVLGLMLLTIGAAFYVWLCSLKGTTNDSPGLLFGVLVALSLVGLMGWCYLIRASLQVESEGLRIVNPINAACVPWTAITRVEGGGTALRVWTTAGWSIGVFAVQKANRERRGSSVSEHVAELLRTHAQQRTQTGQSGAPEKLVKHWGLGWPTTSVYLALIVAAYLYLFWV